MLRMKRHNLKYIKKILKHTLLLLCRYIFFVWRWSLILHIKCNNFVYFIYFVGFMTLSTSYCHFDKLKDSCSVHMCVCALCIYVCTYLCTRMYTHTHTHTHTHIYIYIYTWFTKVCFQRRRKKSVLISSFQRMSITVQNELHSSMCKILCISKGI